MAQDSNVNLKWDAHEATLKSVFHNLLDTESLTDCTVGAEGRHLKAHKVILSACSQYFEQLFRHHLEKHVVIVVPGVQFHILKTLIQFMYRGEILIQQDKLDALLKLADLLQVKGLSYGGNEVSEKKQTHKRRNKSPTYSEHTPSQCHVSPEREQRSDSPELLEVSVGSPQPECLQKQYYTKVTPISAATPKRKKSNVQTSRQESSCRRQSERLKKQDYTKVGPLSTRKRKERDWNTSREEPPLQRELVSPSHVSAHNISLQRPELFNKRNSFCGMFSDVESSSSVTSQFPVRRLGNISKVTVSGEPLTLVVKTSGCPTESEENTITETVREPKHENRSDFNQECMNSVNIDCNDTQCQNLCDNSIATSELCQSSFCDIEFFDQQIQLLEPECTITELPVGHQRSPTTGRFKCTSCDKSYKHSKHLTRHQKYECGKEPQFQCPHCAYRGKRKGDLKQHVPRHFRTLR